MLYFRFAEDKDKFLAQVNITIEDSLHTVYATQPTASNLIFTEPKPAHEVIREKILAPLMAGEQDVSPNKLTDGLEISGDDMVAQYSAVSAAVESEVSDTSKY
jgi:hypothetical protein